MIDWELFKEFSRLHNDVCFQKKSQEDLNSFIIKNKDKLKYPDFLIVFGENVDLFNDEYYENNYEICKIFYGVMQDNPSWREMDFGLRTRIRLGTFEEQFRGFLEKEVCE